ncbi:hypothetical protein BT96DRAFT_1022565 [Gymnopus androsaceus JB14]|uniref:F-box domain-containing protein n=1 Tax=Gymnopus androsaceus JB14 TaxID=1447944 RepID=A0A6A4H8M4_9AGAR|nr:hypothetical protein BT96DRAFT_1022565 [Gymnopus androsaceus JB14]
MAMLMIKAAEERAPNLLLFPGLPKLETQIESLERIRQKDAKLVEIASLRNVLSRIRRVPFEIFELFCLPEDVCVQLGEKLPMLHLKFGPKYAWSQEEGLEFFIPGLLHSITAPLLEDLILHCNGQDIHEIATEMVGFQIRSETALSSLSLKLYHRLEFNTMDLLTILASFPSASSFRIHNHLQFLGYQDTYDINSLLQSMMYTDNHAVLLPKLEDFELLYTCPWGFHILQIWNPMILSRCTSEHSMWRIGKVHDDMLSRLQKVMLHRLPGIQRSGN